jgi:hypothetical protein
MSHPKDRRHRFLIGKKKGEERGYRYWNGMKGLIYKNQPRDEVLERAFYLRRNTTKLCSCSMCGNPRRVAWKDKLTMQEKKFFESLEF